LVTQSVHWQAIGCGLSMVWLMLMNIWMISWLL